MMCDSALYALQDQARDKRAHAYKVRFISSTNKGVCEDIPRRCPCLLYIEDDGTARIYCDSQYSWWTSWHTTPLVAARLDARTRRIVLETANSVYEFAVCQGTQLFD